MHNKYKPKKCGHCQNQFNPKVQFQIFCSIKCFQKNKALKNPDNWHQTGQGIISPNIIKQWEKS